MIILLNYLKKNNYYIPWKNKDVKKDLCTIVYNLTVWIIMTKTISHFTCLTFLRINEKEVVSLT